MWAFFNLLADLAASIRGLTSALVRITREVFPAEPRVVFAILIGEQSGPVAPTPRFFGPRLHKRNLVMEARMTDSQFTVLTPRFLDKNGNPAKVDGSPEYSTDNTDLLSLEPGTLNDDGTFTIGGGISCRVSAVGPLGSASVTMKADADLGEGQIPLFGTAAITIDAGQATNVELSATEPKEQG